MDVCSLVVLTFVIQTSVYSFVIQTCVYRWSQTAVFFPPKTP